jgi:hypothetical protein
MNASDQIPVWRSSAKGNVWAKVGDHLLVAGQSPFGVWLSVDGEFIKGQFISLDEAKSFAEAHIKTLEGN